MPNEDSVHPQSDSRLTVYPRGTPVEQHSLQNNGDFRISSPVDRPLWKEFPPIENNRETIVKGTPSCPARYYQIIGWQIVASRASRIYADW
jgi:hypothetical protein